MVRHTCICLLSVNGETYMDNLFIYFILDILCQQMRGFKTRRSEATGLAGGQRIARIEPIKVTESNANIVSYN